LADIVLEVSGLKTVFENNNRQVSVVNGVDFTVYEGEIVGIVGESGCGKSMTSLSIMSLLPQPYGKIAKGSIKYMGRNLVDMTEKEMRKIRGGEISMIFQEPMTSLNPAYSIGKQIDEMILLHEPVNKKEARRRTIELLKRVSIPRSEEIVNEFPHQLSGGMRQRVMIAIAMACNPKLLIADEPTTALDVTIQAQILELMKNLQQETGSSIILITHDLGVVAETCQRVMVMYAGQIVEEGPVLEIFKNPSHPYTKGLLNSIPKLHEQVEMLEAIPGSVPSPSELQKGCSFASRCSFVEDRCLNEQPNLKEVSGNTDHRSRCLLIS
jgi:peptide/nickel transport system ATP-binding protein